MALLEKKIDLFSEIWPKFEKMKNVSLDLCQSMVYTNFEQFLVNNNMFKGCTVICNLGPKNCHFYDFLKNVNFRVKFEAINRFYR